MTFRQLHEEWWEAVRPPSHTHHQAAEMQKAFYSGAFVMLTEVQKISATETSEDAGALRIELLDQELREFFEALVNRKGGAG